MVTVREQLPGRLHELSEEATVEHAAEAQSSLVSWLDRVRDILDGAELEAATTGCRAYLTKRV